MHDDLEGVYLLTQFNGFLFVEVQMLLLYALLSNLSPLLQTHIVLFVFLGFLPAWVDHDYVVTCRLVLHVGHGEVDLNGAGLVLDGDFIGDFDLVF